MRRFLFMTVFTIMALFPFMLFAQEAPSVDDDKKPETGIFPVALFLEAAEYAADGCWQPDWPLEIPVDAFTLFTDNWLSISVSVGEDLYCLRRSDDGCILEFPFLFEGELVQARLDYEESGEKQVSVASFFEPGSEEPFVGLEILEYRNGYPYMIRVRQDALYSFVLLGKKQQGITEAWFDVNGQLSAVYEHRLVRAAAAPPRMRIEISELRSGETGFDEGYSMSIRSFDSRFLVTGISGSSGEFTLNYSGEKFPRYLDRNPGRYSYQWDKEGFLVRFSGIVDDETDDNALVDCRYEYKLDSAGNWVERQETVMARHFGYLAAESGAVISRVLEYDGPLDETSGLANE